MSAPPTVPDPEAEVHIAGILVQSLPGREQDVGQALAGLPATEVHGAAAGKLVAVCECATAAQIMDLIDRMRDLPGVANVALVYQHTESAQAMEEEIGHENDPPRLY